MFWEEEVDLEKQMGHVERERLEYGPVGSWRGEEEGLEEDDASKRVVSKRGDDSSMMSLWVGGRGLERE